MPHVRVRVTEQNPVGATFGFGVVFSDQALGFLAADDKETHDLITPHMERWRDMTLNHPDGRVTIDGVGFASIGRLELIEILRKRAESLGVEMRFSHLAHFDQRPAGRCGDWRRRLELAGQAKHGKRVQAAAVIFRQSFRMVSGLSGRLTR